MFMYQDETLDYHDEMCVYLTMCVCVCLKFFGLMHIEQSSIRRRSNFVYKILHGRFSLKYHNIRMLSLIVPYVRALKRVFDEGISHVEAETKWPMICREQFHVVF